MNTQQLIKIIVIIALLGFVAISVYVFYHCYVGKTITANVNYLFNILNGLVGGIFALAFGLPKPTQQENSNALDQKLQNLGGMMTNETNKEILGYLYSLSYMLIGFVAIGLWLFKGDQEACNNVTSVAFVFLGMVGAIVTSFFKKDN